MLFDENMFNVKFSFLYKSGLETTTTVRPKCNTHAYTDVYKHSVEMLDLLLIFDIL